MSSHCPETVQRGWNAQVSCCGNISRHLWTQNWKNANIPAWRRGGHTCRGQGRRCWLGKTTGYQSSGRLRAWSPSSAVNNNVLFPSRIYSSCLGSCCFTLIWMFCTFSWCERDRTFWIFSLVLQTQWLQPPRCPVKIKLSLNTVCWICIMTSSRIKHVEPHFPLLSAAAGWDRSHLSILLSPLQHVYQPGMFTRAPHQSTCHLKAKSLILFQENTTSGAARLQSEVWSCGRS